MTGLIRCTAVRGPCKWVLQGRADGCHLEATPACATRGRASFCLVGLYLGLSPAQAAADQAALFIRTDTRSELAGDAFRCGCCCTARRRGVGEHGALLNGRLVPIAMEALSSRSVMTATVARRRGGRAARRYAWAISHCALRPCRGCLRVCGGSGVGDGQPDGSRRRNRPRDPAGRQGPRRSGR